jgi:hypothetical protein
MDGVDSIREVLGTKTIYLREQEDDTGIFDHVDVFVNLRLQNETVQEVVLWIPFHSPIPTTMPPSRTHRYTIWVKIAEGIGHLQALREITISQDHSMDEWEVLVPDLEILACIIRHLQRRIRLYMCDDAVNTTMESRGSATLCKSYSLTGHDYRI